MQQKEGKGLKGPACSSVTSDHPQPASFSLCFSSHFHWWQKKNLFHNKLTFQLNPPAPPHLANHMQTIILILNISLFRTQSPPATRHLAKFTSPATTPRGAALQPCPRCARRTGHAGQPQLTGGHAVQAAALLARSELQPAAAFSPALRQMLL